MKARPLSRLLLGAALAALAASAAAETRTAASPATVERIDALLGQRLRPAPLPVDPPNPFVVTSGLAGAITATVTDADGDPLAVEGNSAEILAQLAARLRIGGMIRQKDQLHIIINDAPRREGDAIILERGGTPLHVFVVRILPGRVVIRFRDAEQILRY